MSTPKDGGPAFPTDTEHQSGPSTLHFEGMSLRDYFAAKALAGQLAAETDEYGFVDELVHPETGGPVYGKLHCHAVKSGNGKDVGYTYDQSKPLVPILKRSAERIYAERSYAMADAMLAAREAKKEGAS